MAITSAICTSFKVELLKGVHDFTATTGNTFKIALYTSSASLGASTTAYSTSNEIQIHQELHTLQVEQLLQV